MAVSDANAERITATAISLMAAKGANAMSKEAVATQEGQEGTMEEANPLATSSGTAVTCLSK
jgi:hypothetical protein